MIIRRLCAAEDRTPLALLGRILAVTRPPLAFAVDVEQATSCSAICTHAGERTVDVILLDWRQAGADTPSLGEELFRCEVNLRVVTLLTQALLPYRSSVWAAGACASIPRVT